MRKSLFAPTLYGICILLTATAYYFLVLHDNNSFNMNIFTTKNREIHLSSEQSGHSLKPFHSNQWYTTLEASFPSHPIYAFPLAFRVTEKGLGISNPIVNAKANTVGAPYEEELNIGFAESMRKPVMRQIDDWSIRFSQSGAKENSMNVTMGQGFPFVLIESDSDLILSSDTSFILKKNDAHTTVTDAKFGAKRVLVQVGTHWYLIASENTINFSKSRNSYRLVHPGKIIIALLDSPDHQDLFARLTSISSLSTDVSFQEKSNTIATTFKINSDSSTLLIALFPHHYNALTDDLHVYGSYDTLRGSMKLVATTQFTTTVPKPTLDNEFHPSEEGKKIITTQLHKDVAAYLKENIPGSRNYGLATWIGKGTTLLQLSKTYGLQKEETDLKTKLENALKIALASIHYRKDVSSMVADKPEFGNDKLNDHHFHYGYLIRAAAVLSADNPILRARIAPHVEDLVTDIAMMQKNDDRFPYARTFNPYEGHSWADGMGGFDDGMNQESTSEALQAWYAVWMWKKLAGDETYASFAQWLFASELQSTKYYWFDTASIYPGEYRHPLISLLWGGKADFATWFSPKPNMIYGIQLLPFTPASTYLADFGSIDSYMNDVYGLGGNEDGEWGDLLLAWQAMYEPQNVIDRISKKPIGHEGNMPVSLLMHIAFTSKDRLQIP